MEHLLEKFKKIRIQKTTIDFLGMSLELGIEESKKIGPEHLRELYIIRNILSRFYFLYQNKKEDLKMYDSNEEVVYNSLIIGLHHDAIQTYKKLADVLLGSEYFLLLDLNVRNKIIESFDYVMVTDTYLEVNEDHDLDESEIAPIIDELLNLFEVTSKNILELQEKVEIKS